MDIFQASCRSPLALRNPSISISCLHSWLFNSTKMERKEIIQNRSLTFHDINNAADISLFDDEALCCILHGIHAVDDLTNLCDIQIFHEIIIQYCRFDELTRSENKEKKNNSVLRLSFRKIKMYIKFAKCVCYGSGERIIINIISRDKHRSNRETIVYIQGYFSLTIGNFISLHFITDWTPVQTNSA